MRYTQGEYEQRERYCAVIMAAYFFELHCYTQRYVSVIADTASSQFCVRILSELDELLVAYAKQNGTTKTKVMVDALAYYLDLVIMCR